MSYEFDGFEDIVLASDIDVPCISCGSVIGDTVVDLVGGAVASETYDPAIEIPELPQYVGTLICLKCQAETHIQFTFGEFQPARYRFRL